MQLTTTFFRRQPEINVKVGYLATVWITLVILETVCGRYHGMDLDILERQQIGDRTSRISEVNISINSKACTTICYNSCEDGVEGGRDSEKLALQFRPFNLESSWYVALY